MTKESRQNIIIMSIVAIMFIIGIVVRWDVVSPKMGSAFMGYINALDSVTGQKDPIPDEED